MRAVVQRVSRAAVTVDGETTGEIGDGLLVLLGVAAGDGDADAEALAAKVAGLRVLGDEHGAMNRSVADTGGAVLVVSQFTLLADVRKGRRPSFIAAAPPEDAARLVRRFEEALAAAGVPVERGRFGAHMQVDLCNDGPVTIVIEARDGRVL